MSDDDALCASATSPVNCAEEVTTSTVEDSHGTLEQSRNGNDDGGSGKSIRVEEQTKVKTSSDGDGGPAKDECVVDSNVSTVDDHETLKGKRKCVQFASTLSSDTDDITLRKFIEGDEILDKKNPFKVDDESLRQHPLLRGRMQDSRARERVVSNTHEIDEEKGSDGDDEVDNDNEFITKEEILRQSKYVKTYIKNPDKRLNYDKSVIQQMNAMRAQGRDVRDVVVFECTSPPPPMVRPPIPAPRAIYQRSDRNNNNRMQRLPQQRTGNPKPTPRARRDYAEVKVRTGSADAEESLYDSNEVVLNALKFDSRFRQVEFGSQDDIDTIAEKTETADGVQTNSDDVSTKPKEILTPPSFSAPAKGQGLDGKKSTFAEDVKKSFSNTVKSADFMKYLQSKGLSLVPARQPKSLDGSKRTEVKPLVKSANQSIGGVAGVPPTPPRQQTKLSVLTKFLHNSLFTPKTANDPAYSPALIARSSTPVHYSAPAHAHRAQFPLRNGYTGGTLVKRSTSVDAKPKVSFRQFDHVDAASIRRPVSVNDFDRPKLRTGFANQSMTRIELAKRPVKNAGVQVNLANGSPMIAPASRTGTAVPLRPGSWQPVIASAPAYGNGEAANHPMMSPYTVHHRLDNRYGRGSTSGSLQTVAPLYSEPLREMAVVQVGNNQSTADAGYHIYEQTPDNLRRELIYGKISQHTSNGQMMNRWHPQDRRSYSSMQEGVGGGDSSAMGNGTYGRLRPLYVPSPLSTQSTPVRRASESIDREQILHRIYDFCRRSIRNSSKSSVHSNQTEPLYQASPGVRMTGSGSFPIERPRVQRVQSLTNPRSITGTNYMRTAVGPTRANQPPRTLPSAARRNQHDKNIENIYAFVNKKMNQMNVGGAGDTVTLPHGGSTRSLQTTAPSTLRRVTFSRASELDDSSYGFDEADYVNIRGAPDGIQYRTTQC